MNKLKKLLETMFTYEWQEMSLLEQLNLRDEAAADFARMKTAAQKVVSVGRGHAGKERNILIEAAIKELKATLKRAGVK